MKKIPVLLFLSLFLSACAPKPDAAAGDDGFALLYSITSQQQNVDKLLWIKDPGAATEAWVEQIATFNQAVTKQLEAWRDGGQVSSLTARGLPSAEIEARERATRRTTGELLFSQDVDLRISLILAQLKALGYCADLSYAIGQETSDEAIKTTVANWDTRFKELNAKGMALLENKATTTEATPPATTQSPAPARK
ncbi:hypothetical protein [Cerasicoccus arenae]|uniref:Uncharacterized protein n=1 Tax=Cerasicoccus arenae TaxID=424488 RepID=A0A8J3GCH1_9BACT|nr:hypothetical protein [Cerasicoccus arenae]MBK1859443.1 hypothetical protein [Cerasicoccus arenae]GHB94163.1 hypothetical protein GCM10007047_07280 [Cerasicoccus arenae]